ncbi:MAG: GNAT family N-acetyltransferase [Lachnospiraceae bacterium]|nr:GNAT family N-acetyltransferase [Lachnospiraceae bacterium]
MDKIRRQVGEAFVSNELFHNWGSEEERREDVLKYMSLYVDYVYKAGELYVNDDMTGYIGLEDSAGKPKFMILVMLIKMLIRIRYARIKSLLQYANQLSGANGQYAKQRHIDALMVCVDKQYQGKGIASELVTYAKEMADEMHLPLLFDTDMKEYAAMYEHLGCELYNTITADNGVTRYSLCYHKD